MKKRLAFIAALFCFLALRASAQTTVTGTFKPQTGQTPAAAGLTVLQNVNGTPVCGELTFVAYNAGNGKPTSLLWNNENYLPQQTIGYVRCSDGVLINPSGAAGVSVIPNVDAQPAGSLTWMQGGLTASSDGTVPATSWSEAKAIPDQSSVDWGSLPVATIVDVGYQTVELNGVGVNPRPTLNFIGGATSCVDNNASNRTDCTYSPSGFFPQTNGTNNTSQTGLNFVNNGPFSWSNPSSGNEQLAFASGSANQFLATPNGTSGAPTLRALVTGDLPTGIPVADLAASTIGLAVPSWLSVSGSPATLGNSLTLSAAGAQTSHEVIGTCGTATSFGPCALVASDIPQLAYSSLAGLPTLAANTPSVSHEWLNSYNSTTGAFTQTQPACADLSNSSGGCSMSTTATGDISGTLPNVTVTNGSHITNASITSSALNITTTACTNQVVTAIGSGGVGTCASLTSSFLPTIPISLGGTNATSAAAGQVPNSTSGTASAWTSALTLGASGTLGSVTMSNATSGSVTLEPVTGALGSVTASLPANTGTIAETNLAQTFTATQIFPNLSIANSELANSSLTINAPGGMANWGAVSLGGTLSPSWSVSGSDYVFTSTAANTGAWEQVNGGSSCGDASHATSYSATTHTFGCQAISTTGVTIQTGGTNNSVQGTLNFTNPSSFNGLSFSFSNPSGGNETFSVTGTLSNSGLANPSTTVNNQPCTLGSSCVAPPVAVVANSSSGTTANTLTKLTGAPSTAVTAATTDTSGVVGITTAGAGTSGNATVTLSGQAPCVFDAGTTAGDYVQISSSVAGECHDYGSAYPASGQIVGRVLSTNASSGTYAIYLFDEIQGPFNAGNLSAGTLPAARLPNPTGSSLGGVESYTSPAHQWITQISTSGAPSSSQPVFADISGAASEAQLPGTTVFTDQAATFGAHTYDFSAALSLKAPIGAGFAPTANGTFGYDSTANDWVFGQNGATVKFGLSSAACASNEWVNTPATATAQASCSQPAFTNISGSVAASQLPNPSASTLGGIESAAAVSNEWIDSINTSGVPHLSQPGFSNLSGSIAIGQTALTTLGDLLYANATPALARLAGNTSTTKQFLTQTGNGTISSAPAWGTIAAGDIPSGNSCSANQFADSLGAGLALGCAQPSYANLSGTPLQETNASTTGTTVNTLTKLNSSGNAVIAGTSDTAVPVFIAVSGTGTSGSVNLATFGIANCVFDGATTAGHFVQASTSTGGDCHDAGATAPTSGWVIGQVNSTNGSGGTYAVTLEQGYNASAGGGTPGGSAGQLQWNNTSFAGVTGSSITSGGAINLSPTDTSHPSLLVNCPSGITVDCADWELGSTKEIYMDSTGNIHISGTLTTNALVVNASYFDFTEVANPGAPAATAIRFYAQPTVASPSAPTVAAPSAGGSLAASQQATVEVTYVDAAGETLASAVTNQTTATSATCTASGNCEIVVTSPSAAGDATGYNIYANTCATAPCTGLTKQNGGTPVSLGTNFTWSSLASGSAPPSLNTTSPGQFSQNSLGNFAGLVPGVAGFTTTTNGVFGYDTTNNNEHLGASGVDNLLGMIPSSTTIHNLDCVGWSNVSSTIRLTDISPCDAVPVDAQTGTSYTIPSSDNLHLVTLNNASAIALTGPSPANNITFYVKNLGAGLATETPASGTINGNATQIIPQNWFAPHFTDNTNWFAPVMPTIQAFVNCANAGQAMTINTANGVFGCNTVGQVPKQNSAATNFGSTLSAQTVVSSVPTAAQQISLLVAPIQSTLGVGCGAGSNTVAVTVSYTAPGGSAKTLVLATLTISANGALDSGSDSGSTSEAPAAIIAKSGTSITYTTASTLVSTGCSTTPQYTVYAKAIF